VSTIGTDDLRQLASAKSAEIAAKRPDLKPALALQLDILHLLLDAAERLEDSAAAAPEMTRDLILAKWTRGVPAFRGVLVAFPSALKDMLPEVCAVLVRGGAGDSAVHIKDALTKGEINAESLLRVSFARDQKAIRTSSIHMGLAPDLVWLVGELGSSVLAHRLQAALLTSPDLGDSVRDWDRGYCPCCGSWPALVELLDGERVLRCSFCAAAWELTSHRCIYCGNADKRFVAAAPDMAHQDRRLELCGGCGSYTKVIEVGSLTPFPLVAIEDLATMDLDEGAIGRQYGRPPLFDLDAIDPPALPGCG
jgi:Protein involved in formate dehydrogenase formation